MTYSIRIWIVVGIALAAGVGTLLLEPVPQDPTYHLFADGRSCLGIPNFGNVVSNMSFTIVGLAGLMVLYAGKTSEPQVPIGDTLPFAVFFIGVALVGAQLSELDWRAGGGAWSTGLAVVATLLVVWWVGKAAGLALRREVEVGGGAK